MSLSACFASSPTCLPVRRRTREGLIIRTGYDRLDRRISESERLADDSNLARNSQWWRGYDGAFQYGLSGRMTQASTSQITRNYTYDLAGRPATHTRSGADGDFTFGYDVAGNLTSIDHGGGVIAYYAWDEQSRMTGVTLSVGGSGVGSAALAYDTLGRRTGLGFGDGSYQSYAWEIDGDLTAIGHAYPGRPADNVTFSYAHDRIGRVTTEQINHAAYDYEAQLASVAYGAATAINTYPSVGGTTFGYGDAASINPDQLHSDGAIHQASPWNYRYDAHGNLRNTASLNYQNQTSYYPDALGERFWTVHYDTSTGPQTSFYSFSDGLRPETVQEPTYSRPSNTGSWTSTGTRTYVLGPLPDERLIYRASDGQIYYPHTDRRGSTVALSQGASGQGMAVQTYAYDEFGQSGPSGSSGYPYRYTGQRLDPWTGTYHYKAREYSPNLGRFLQPDPARFVDGPNMYAYVGNNPWNLIDPMGLEIRVTLYMYPLIPGGPNHAYTQYEDTETGESYIARAGIPRAVIRDVIRTPVGTAIIPGLDMTPVNTPETQSAEATDPVITGKDHSIVAEQLVDMSMEEAIGIADQMTEQFDSARRDYGHDFNSNTFATQVYEALTGDRIVRDDLPGSESRLEQDGSVSNCERARLC